MGSQSVLFGKCTMELLIASFKGDGLLFAKWQTYLVLLGLGVSIVLQIRWLNEALRRFDSMFVVPVFQVWALIHSSHVNSLL